MLVQLAKRVYKNISSSKNIIIKVGQLVSGYEEQEQKTGTYSDN